MLTCLLSFALAAEPPDPGAGALAVVPFGVAHFAWQRPVRGVAYAVTQAAGVGVGAYGAVQADAAMDASDEAALEQWQLVTGVSIGAAALSYAIQVVDGSRLAETRAMQAADSRARRESVLAFDAALARAVEPRP